MKPIAACTLFEGHYAHGVAALCNSLHTCGFRGNVWAGYKGALPKWLRESRLASCGVRIMPVPLGDKQWHLAHQKPAFMSQVLRQLDPAAGGVAYFDPDIVCLAPWRFFEQWISFGVAACEDGVYNRMDHTHPLRKLWMISLGESGITTRREMNYYLNSGFIGVSRPHLEFLEVWHQVLACIESQGVNLQAFKPGVRTDPWFGTDQDALNAALMSTDVPLSIMGPDGMGFRPGGYIMHHATDSPKPWQCGYVSRLLVTGNRPSPEHRSFWGCVDGVFRSMSTSAVWRRRLGLKIALGLSRIYRR